MRENAKYKRVTEELNHTTPEGEKAVVTAPAQTQGYDWQYVESMLVHVGGYVHCTYTALHRNLRLMGRFFWARMIASMFGWFLNDFVRMLGGL